MMESDAAEAEVDDDAYDETQPSPLLDLVKTMPYFFAKEVLARLDPADRALLAQVAIPFLSAVAAAAAGGGSGLLRAGKSAGVPLKLVDFIGSVKRLA